MWIARFQLYLWKEDFNLSDKGQGRMGGEEHQVNDNNCFSTWEKFLATQLVSPAN